MRRPAAICLCLTIRARTPILMHVPSRSVNITDPLFSSYSSWMPVVMCYYNCTQDGVCPQTPLAATTSVPPPTAGQCGGCAGNYNITNAVTLVSNTTGRLVDSASVTTTLSCGACAAIVTLNSTTTRTWSWCVTAAGCRIFGPHAHHIAARAGVCAPLRCLGDQPGACGMPKRARCACLPR